MKSEFPDASAILKDKYIYLGYQSMRNYICEIVRSLEIFDAHFVNRVFYAPWAIAAQVTAQDCRQFAQSPKRLIAYHVVVEGEIVLCIADKHGRKQHHHAKPGDVIVLPNNKKHILASSMSKARGCCEKLILPENENGPVHIQHSSKPEKASILCGFLGSKALDLPILEMLPEAIIINFDNLATRRWIKASAMMATREYARSPAAKNNATLEICKLLLVVAFEAYINQFSTSKGFQNGIAHPRIARALSRIHTTLDCPLSVEDLAADAGMSRSAFVERFKKVMGTGPRRYILNQRMEKARQLLTDGQMTVAEIAIHVGYDAPEAFSRAFKRELGLAPAKWREAA